MQKDLDRRDNSRILQSALTTRVLYHACTLHLRSTASASMQISFSSDFSRLQGSFAGLASTLAPLFLRCLQVFIGFLALSFFS